VETWWNPTKQCLKLEKLLVVTVWKNVPLGGEKTNFLFLINIDMT